MGLASSFSGCWSSSGCTSSSRSAARARRLIARLGPNGYTRSVLARFARRPRPDRLGLRALSRARLDRRLVRRRPSCATSPSALMLLSVDPSWSPPSSPATSGAGSSIRCWRREDLGASRICCRTAISARSSCSARSWPGRSMTASRQAPHRSAAAPIAPAGWRNDADRVVARHRRSISRSALSSIRS